MESPEVPKLELGASCGDSTMCTSGNCVDRYCCEARCGACSTCGLTGSHGRCSPIAAGDDADSCNGTKTCGSSAECLTIDDQQILSGLGVYVGKNVSPNLRLAQVVTMREAGRLVELKMAWWCKKKEDALSVTVNAVNSDGTPSAKILSTTRVHEPEVQFPGRAGEPSFDSLPLVAPFSVNAGDRLALVVESPLMTAECMLYSAKMEAYAGGEQFALLADTSMWVRRAEDFAFKTLVAR